MSYVFENITQDDVEKILKDVSAYRRLEGLIKRRDYFEDIQSIYWSINREIDCYFMYAPKIDVRSPNENFMFFFAGQMHRLVLTRKPRFLKFDRKVPETHQQAAIVELNKAYKAFGVIGQGENSKQWMDFNVEFAS
ncbi:MAG: hypothetical protein AAGB12_01750 [Pseudomonadota bacterium]